MLLVGEAFSAPLVGAVGVFHEFVVGALVVDADDGVAEVELSPVLEVDGAGEQAIGVVVGDIPKPSIAAVQGGCIAGALLLVWPCDLIVASDDAYFTDFVARMGIGGVEYHGHTWELGARKAKEMRFTGMRMGAAEAERRGMVNRVVPRESLDQAAFELAAEIARIHPFALAMAKRAVNQTLDIQGQYSSLQSVFDVHTLGHANAMIESGYPILAWDLRSLAEQNKNGS